MKTSKLLLKLLLFTALFLLLTKANAQQNKTDKPDWVRLMDDSTVNYFTAVKAFNDFWMNKEKPLEEDEIFESNATKTKRREVNTEDAKKYALDYKRFLNWQRYVLPYVQPDGRILSKKEILKILEAEGKRRTQPGN